MDTASFSAIAEVLSATSPYGVLVALGYGLWRVTERKDKEIKALKERMAELAEKQTAALGKVEAALQNLTKAIEQMMK